MQVIVDNLLTNYKLQGKGKVVVLLHGWGDNSDGSVELQKALSAHYQVLAPDLPGFGQTQIPPTAWNLDDYAQFVGALLKKLRLEPYAIIGHSNGGAIAIRGMALNLLTPQKLILMASAGIRSGKNLRRGALQVVAKTGKVATLGLPKRYRRQLRQKLYTSAGSDLLVVESLQETFKKTVRQDVQADAAQIKVPTLLIFAENDTSVPAGAGRTFQQLIKGSVLQMIPDAGHFVHLDKAQQTTALIEEFLK